MWQFSSLISFIFTVILIWAGPICKLNTDTWWVHLRNTDRPNRLKYVSLLGCIQNSHHGFGFPPAWSLDRSFWRTEFSSKIRPYVYFFNADFILEKTKKMYITRYCSLVSRLKVRGFYSELIIKHLYILNLCNKYWVPTSAWYHSRPLVHGSEHNQKWSDGA